MKKIMPAIIVLLILALGFLQTGCADSNAESRNEKEASDAAKSDSSKANNDAAKVERVPVEVAAIGTGEISSTILLSSNLETEEMADVYSRVQGIVEKLFAEEGEYVQKGTQLVKLEADEFALGEAGARVNFEQQQNAFERAEAMFNKQLLSKEEYEQAKYTMQNARIQWEKAKLDVKYTRIEAPISGVIGVRSVRPGDRIQPSDKLFTVINTNEMIAVVHVPEKEIGRLKKGQKAVISSNNLGNERYDAWIKRVSPVVDPQSGTFKVTIGVKNVNNKLRPGMFVNAYIITDTHKDAVLVPKTAIVYENEYMNVFVVRDSVAQKIRLKPGYQNYEFIESLENVDAGDKVIVVGQAGMKDRTAVKIVAER